MPKFSISTNNGLPVSKGRTKARSTIAEAYFHKQRRAFELLGWDRKVPTKEVESRKPKKEKERDSNDEGLFVSNQRNNRGFSFYSIITNLMSEESLATTVFELYTTEIAFSPASNSRFLCFLFSLFPFILFFFIYSYTRARTHIHICIYINFSCFLRYSAYTPSSDLYTMSACAFEKSIVQNGRR